MGTEHVYVVYDPTRPFNRFDLGFRKVATSIELTHYEIFEPLKVPSITSFMLDDGDGDDWQHAIDLSQPSLVIYEGRAGNGVSKSFSFTPTFTGATTGSITVVVRYATDPTNSPHNPTQFYSLPISPVVSGSAYTGTLNMFANDNQDSLYYDFTLTVGAVSSLVRLRVEQD